MEFRNRQSLRRGIRSTHNTRERHCRRRHRRTGGLRRREHVKNYRREARRIRHPRRDDLNLPVVITRRQPRRVHRNGDRAARRGAGARALRRRYAQPVVPARQCVSNRRPPDGSRAAIEHGDCSGSHRSGIHRARKSHSGLREHERRRNRLNAPYTSAPPVRDIQVARGIERHVNRESESRFEWWPAVSGKGRRSIARERRDLLRLPVHPPDHMVVRVGDSDGPAPVHGHALWVGERSGGGRAPIARIPIGTVARHRRNNARWRDRAHHVVPVIGEVDVAGCIHRDARGAVEPAPRWRERHCPQNPPRRLPAMVVIVPVAETLRIRSFPVSAI